jgi:hypothetical protein
MNATIEIDGLRQRFGPVQALDGMTFTVGPGQVTGFVGPNGAGKPNLGHWHFSAWDPGNWASTRPPIARRSACFSWLCPPCRDFVTRLPVRL